MGRRIGKKRNGALVQGWLYDGQLRIDSVELDGSGQVVIRFAYVLNAKLTSHILTRLASYEFALTPVLTSQLELPGIVARETRGTTIAA